MWANEIKEDALYLRYRRILKNVSPVEIESLTKEVMNLHAAREGRSLEGKDIGASKLQKISAQNQSYRSRITEIWAQERRLYGGLKIAIDKVQNHILMAHFDLIPRRSKGDKLNYISARFFSKGKQRLQLLEESMLICENISIDIDKAAWAMNFQLDCLKQLNRPEHTI